MDFLNAYLELPFGSRTKLETELLIFSALISRGDMDVTSSSFEIATKLRITNPKPSLWFTLTKFAPRLR